jgi:hypothetical protein
MAVSSLSIIFTESAAACGNSALDAANIESKEAGLIVLGPWDTVPPELGRCISATGFLSGGNVLPPQYKRAIKPIATAIAI